MARYERAVIQGSAVGTGTTIFDIRTSSTVEAKILEIGLTIGGTSNTEVGLIRANTVGTASTSVSGEKPDLAAVASATVIGTAWSSAPTISGTPYLRQVYIGGTVGNGFIWQWARESALIIPVSASILLWNVGAAQASICRGWVVWEE
jgi:hypothetical protein